MDRPLLYLIDALPYVFRAYFAIRELRSPQGQPVHAVYGFTAFLLQLLRREPLTHVGVAFDESLTSSFRNAFFPAYKANRALPPPDLAWQLQQCQAVARALGLPVFVDQLYEADDLIGTLARALRVLGQERSVEILVEAIRSGLSTSLLLSEQRYRQHMTRILVYGPCRRFFGKTA